MLAAAPAHVKAAVKESIAVHKRRADYQVLPDVWHAVQVFDGMSTQWNAKLALGGLLYLGLNYAALPIVLAEHRGTAHRQPLDVLMPQLRFLEAEARSLLNQR